MILKTFDYSLGVDKNDFCNVVIRAVLQTGRGEEHLSGSGTSRRSEKALAYALEEIAQKLKEMGP